MKTLLSPQSLLVLLTACVAPAIQAATAVPTRAAFTSDPVYKKILKLDASLTNACNRGDENDLSNLFADNLQFSRDNQYLLFNKKSFIAEMKRTVFGQARREVLPGSVHVYPIVGWGAMEIGAQRFVRGASKSGPASKFVMLWHSDAGNWKITQIVNFTTGLVPPAKKTSTLRLLSPMHAVVPMSGT